MTSDKLTALIARERKNLEGYKKKRAEYESKIKNSEAKLQQYEMMESSQKFDAVSAAVAQSGLSLDAVLAALQNGDLLALQEQMEAAQSEKGNSQLVVEEAENEE